MPHKVPSRPWEKVGANIFEHDDKEYLIMVDYYSNFWEVDRLPDMKASTVILKLKNHFARYGCPVQVVSDNGPQARYYNRGAKDLPSLSEGDIV